MLQAGETPDAEALIRELAQRVPQHEDELMTLAQQLEQKGREKGRQEGIQEGMQKGMQQGMQKGMQQGIQLGGKEARLEIARNMLESGLDRASVMKMTGLSEEDLNQIRH